MNPFDMVTCTVTCNDEAPISDTITRAEAWACWILILFVRCLTTDTVRCTIKS